MLAREMVERAGGDDKEKRECGVRGINNLGVTIRSETVKNVYIQFRTPLFHIVISHDICPLNNVLRYLLHDIVYRCCRKKTFFSF